MSLILLRHTGHVFLVPADAGAPKRTLMQELHAQCPHGIMAVFDILHLQTGHSADMVMPGADKVAGDASTAAAVACTAGTDGTASGDTSVNYYLVLSFLFMYSSSGLSTDVFPNKTNINTCRPTGLVVTDLVDLVDLTDLVDVTCLVDLTGLHVIVAAAVVVAAVVVIAAPVVVTGTSAVVVG